jgi:hypothetical protein
VLHILLLRLGALPVDAGCDRLLERRRYCCNDAHPIGVAVMSLETVR